MNEYLEQAKGQIGDTRQDLSALTCAMIAQAEAMERMAKAMERIADAQEDIAGAAYDGYLLVKTYTD